MSVNKGKLRKLSRKKAVDGLSIVKKESQSRIVEIAAIPQSSDTRPMPPLTSFNTGYIRHADRHDPL